MPSKRIIPKLPSLGRKKNTDLCEQSSYTDDINYDNCKHKRAKVYEVEPEWEIDKVSIVLHCPDCERIGEVEGRLKYYENDVNWG